MSVSNSNYLPTFSTTTSSQQHGISSSSVSSIPTVPNKTTRPSSRSIRGGGDTEPLELEYVAVPELPLLNLRQLVYSARTRVHNNNNNTRSHDNSSSSPSCFEESMPVLRDDEEECTDHYDDDGTEEGPQEDGPVTPTYQKRGRFLVWPVADTLGYYTEPHHPVKEQLRMILHGLDCSTRGSVVSGNSSLVLTD